MVCVIYALKGINAKYAFKGVIGGYDFNGIWDGARVHEGGCAALGGGSPGERVGLRALDRAPLLALRPGIVRPQQIKVSEIACCEYANNGSVYSP